MSEFDEINEKNYPKGIKDKSGDEMEKGAIDKEYKIKLYEDEINYKNSQITKINSELSLKDTQISKINSELSRKDAQLKSMDIELERTKLSFESIKKSYDSQLSRLDSKEYCIHCFKEEITNSNTEIEYLKGNSFTKILLNPLAYLYLLLKSKPKELSLNLKLYRALKNSKCFDIGYYLNRNSDIKDSKWCKYFSPELHYVCNGFYEKRKFNKKYFNRNSKEELLDYISKCQ